MFREMTLGQYYHRDSVIHELDPRVKLAGTLIFVISLFLGKSIPGLLCATIFLALIILLAGIPVRLMVRGVKPLLFIILFSAFFNLFGTEGTAVFTIWHFSVTREGIRMAIFLVVRLIYLVMGTSIMTYTTTPNRLTDGLEKSLGFLNRIHIPVHEIAMIMSIALRFIPILTEELDKIMKAQMSRGASFDEGNLVQKARQIVPVLIPLFVSSVRRASELAYAMEARGYHGGSGRTKLHPLRYERRDYMAYAILLLYMILMIVLAIYAGPF